jgi:hypothetical protein
MLIVVAVCVIGATISYYKGVNKKISDAFFAYRSSLDTLKQYPHDPALRERALQAGRYYSNLARSNRGETIFDEVALANDIAAACAGVGQATSLSSTVPTPAQPLEQRLSRLKDLLDSGAMDEQEYRARRAKILDEV